MRRDSPVVGITAPMERVSYRSWRDVPAVCLPASYVAAVRAEGGRPLLLPADGGEDPRGLLGLLGLLDALVLSGGADIDPAAYGAQAHPRTGSVDRARDDMEATAARAAVDRGVPVLGVCRGMQVLNVAYGGTLLQHLPDVVGHDGHNPVAGAFADHSVRARPGSLAAAALGGTEASVRTHHHQGLARVGEGLVVTAWHAADHTPEAVEDPRARYCLGVLWHPEEDPDSSVIAHLVAAAADAGRGPPDQGGAGR